MKIKLSKSQWHFIGRKAGWLKSAKSIGTDDTLQIEDIPDINKLDEVKDPEKKQTDGKEENVFLDPENKKETKKYISKIIPKLSDPDLRKMTNNPAIQKPILETLEALTNIPTSRTKDIIQETQKAEKQILSKDIYLNPQDAMMKEKQKKQ